MAGLLMSLYKSLDFSQRLGNNKPLTLLGLTHLEGNHTYAASQSDTTLKDGAIPLPHAIAS